MNNKLSGIRPDNSKYPAGYRIVRFCHYPAGYYIRCTPSRHWSPYWTGLSQAKNKFHVAQWRKAREKLVWGNAPPENFLNLDP